MVLYVTLMQRNTDYGKYDEAKEEWWCCQVDVIRQHCIVWYCGWLEDLGNLCIKDNK